MQYLFLFALSQIDVQMDAISPKLILIYVCPGTLKVAAPITSHNLLFSFSAQSHEERDNPDTEEARRIVVGSGLAPAGHSAF